MVVAALIDTLALLWRELGHPLVRLLTFISIGLIVAGFIEAMNWTRKMSVVAAPMIRFGHLSDLTGAAFSMAFFSGVAANTMLSEAYEQGRLCKKELFLANMFNSLPAYFLHLPTTFFLTLPLIKGATFIYIGLTLGAALLRTLGIAVLSHFLLGPENLAETHGQQEAESVSFRQAGKRTVARFKKRIRKIIRLTFPIYIVFFWLSEAGMFQLLEEFMADHLTWLAWLSPKAVSIIALQIAAEFSAGLVAAGALLQDGTMTYKEIVLTLLVGNVLSSPIRAVRHQFPYYAGIFKPRLALQLIVFSQSFRAFSIAFVALLYFFLVM
ncbi:hypothetical protein VT98_10573 [Candidatus Electrothrix communis]|uniref:Nucleoside recognition n=1 Tax=Candidatus Electrothrix communis TaxID=1859133 RepID=A0A3S3RVZ3_9BACT|nr:hypothetical protein VT98_10573 [Candidatus Electrothrix communis]WLE95354.1 MAG: hypothetical protein QTN59_11745 [Candidatus Electrothrix communis]